MDLLELLDLFKFPDRPGPSRPGPAQPNPARPVPARAGPANPLRDLLGPAFPFVFFWPRRGGDPPLLGLFRGPEKKSGRSGAGNIFVDFEHFEMGIRNCRSESATTRKWRRLLCWNGKNRFSPFPRRHSECTRYIMASFFFEKDAPKNTPKNQRQVLNLYHYRTCGPYHYRTCAPPRDLLNLWEFIGIH